LWPAAGILDWFVASAYVLGALTNLTGGRGYSRSAVRASIGAETSTPSTSPEGPMRSASAIELAPA
jgi:hypothetical protein